MRKTTMRASGGKLKISITAVHPLVFGSLYGSLFFGPKNTVIRGDFHGSSEYHRP